MRVFFPSFRVRLRDLQVSSAVTACFMFVLAVAYTRPNEFVRPPALPNAPTRVNVVAFIENFTIFPVWTILFGVAGSMCIVAVALDRWGPRAHLMVFVVVAMYAFASYATAFANPATYIVTAVFATAFAYAQMTLMAHYTWRLERVYNVIEESEESRAEFLTAKKAQIQESFGNPQEGVS